MKYRAFTYAFAALFLSSAFNSSSVRSDEPKTASKEKRASSCTAIKNADDRLACYDLFYAANNDKNESSIGKWRINAGKSQKDNTARVLIRVAGELQTSAKNFSGTSIHFYAACRSNVANFWFNFEKHIQSKENAVTVHYEIDDQESKKLKLRQSNNRRSIGEWDDKESKKFLANLMTANSLSIEFSQDDKVPVKVKFDIKGFGNAIQPIQQACAWQSA